jgi:poly-beta-1,6-N-acetyl-D-glucosamine synthase
MTSDSDRKPVRYLIITPARDEERYIEETLRRVVLQTITPSEWVIVDDGSTDSTATVVSSYAARYPWIRLLQRPGGGSRNNNTGAIAAFMDGYHALRGVDWDFVVNLDADISMEPDYFERCFREFCDHPELGIGGGTLYHIEGGATKTEVGPASHVRGATKIYRRACWEAIGGLNNSSGWDTLDEAKANMMGWHTRSFPQIVALHLRPTGAAEGAWRDAVKNGESEYFSGYHPVFMIAKCLRKAFTKPYFTVGAGLFYGFVSSYLTKSPQVDDKALVRHLRRRQLRRLLFPRTCTDKPILQRQSAQMRQGNADAGSH